MIGLGRKLNPLTIKRLRRFKAKRRAYWSFWALTLLYLVALPAELICNDRPLLVRFKGASYFPVLRFYPEDAFTGNGLKTRPDYRRLEQGAAFKDNPRNFMIFPLVPFSPYESIDAATLKDEESVEMRFSPLPHVGNVNIDPAYRAVRSTACGFFFGTGDTRVKGLAVTDRWPLPAAFRRAVARRFKNLPAESVSLTLTATGPEPRPRAELSMPPYSPRSRPPETVRITFREPLPAGAGLQTLRLDRELDAKGRPPPVWALLGEGEREQLLLMARTRFAAPVEETATTVAGVLYRVSFDRDEITWPHPPTSRHWFGIDSAGRDVFARVFYGVRISLTFGFLLVTFSMALGALIGAVQGYFGGWVDITGQRLIEIWRTLPFLYVMILLGAVYGPGFLLLLLCYGIFNWIGISYYVRGEFLRLRRQPFVDSARCMGIPAHTIISRHIMPNALAPIVTFFPFSLVGAIGALAALDYLGFGLPPPTPSWGQLLHQAQQFRWAWWLILYPSLMLFVVMLLGVFIGEGARDAYDPKPYARMR